MDESDYANTFVFEKHNEIPVVITSRSDLDKISSGRVIVTSLTVAERVWLGGKALSITYLITFFFIFIPILHFILVPAGLFIGVIIFFSQFSLKHCLHKGSAVCPICSQTFEIKAGPLRWPKREICPHCCNDLKIEVKTSS